jgi:hypothetical protein
MNTWYEYYSPNVLDEPVTLTVTFEVELPVFTLDPPPVLLFELLPPVFPNEPIALTTKLKFSCITVRALLFVTVTVFEDFEPFPATTTFVGFPVTAGVIVAVLLEPPTLTFTVEFTSPVLTDVLPPVLPFALLPPLFCPVTTKFPIADEFDCSTTVEFVELTLTLLVELEPLPATTMPEFANAAGATAPIITAAVAKAVTNLLLILINIITSFQNRIQFVYFSNERLMGHCC